MRGKAGGWALFLAVLLLLSFAAVTPYWNTFDHAMIAVRLLLVIMLSVLIVRERWQNREDRATKNWQACRDQRETLLQRMWDWNYGEEKRTNKRSEAP